MLVLRIGSTDRALTEAKLNLLDRLPVRIVGAVLNDVPPKGFTAIMATCRAMSPRMSSWRKETQIEGAALEDEAMGLNERTRE